MRTTRSKKLREREENKKKRPLLDLLEQGAHTVNALLRGLAKCGIEGIGLVCGSPKSMKETTTNKKKKETMRGGMGT